MKPHHRWAATVLFAVVSSVSTLSHAASIPSQGTWSTTLQGRDLDGNLATAEAYYDTALNITWLADADYAGTTMNWNTAESWATSLNINGYTGWRLPTTNPVNGSYYDYTPLPDGSTDYGANISAPGTVYAGSTGSELAYMFYNTLGNLSHFDTNGDPRLTGWGLTNTGPFSNLGAANYWSGQLYDPSYYVNLDYRFGFQTFEGMQGGAHITSLFSAWAVHSGDVGAAMVPVPAAVWLFGSGLLGLIGVARRKARSV